MGVFFGTVPFIKKSTSRQGRKTNINQNENNMNLIRVTYDMLFQQPYYASSKLFCALFERYDSYSETADSLDIPAQYYTACVEPRTCEDLDHLLMAAGYWHFRILPPAAIVFLWKMREAVAAEAAEAVSPAACSMKYDLPHALAGDTRQDVSAVHAGHELPHEWALRHDDVESFEYMIRAHRSGECSPPIDLAGSVSFAAETVAVPDSAAILAMCAERGAARCFAAMLKEHTVARRDGATARARCFPTRMIHRCCELLCKIDRADMLRVVLSHLGPIDVQSFRASDCASACAIYNAHTCLQCLVEFFPVAFSQNDWVAWNAAAHGHLECLRIARAAAFGTAANNTGEDDSQRRSSLGQLPIHGPDVDKYVKLVGNLNTFGGVCYAAARRGHLDCLRFSLQNGYPISPLLCTGAAEGGHLACLRYLHEEAHVPWDHSTTRCCSTVECMRYLLQNVCPFDPEDLPGVLAYAARLDCLRLVVSAGGTVDVFTAASAASAGSIACLRYLVEEEHCPVNSSVLHRAARTGSLCCMRYLREKCGCLWYGSTLRLLAQFGSAACFEYAIKSGAPVTIELSVLCANRGRLDMLEILVAHKAPLSPDACEVVSRMGCIQCLRFLITHGCVCEPSSMLAAFDGGHVDCLKYLISTGCAAPCGGLSFGEGGFTFKHARSIAFLVHARREDLLSSDAAQMLHRSSGNRSSGNRSSSPGPAT